VQALVASWSCLARGIRLDQSLQQSGMKFDNKWALIFSLHSLFWLD
jgi:hypothetical protein